MGSKLVVPALAGSAAAVGGLMQQLMGAVGAYVVGGNYVIGLIVFLILIVVLIFKPSGILGRPEVEKV